MTIENSFNGESIKPVGELARVLKEFDAPQRVSNRMARRAGAVMAPNGLTVDFVTEQIIESMGPNGMPRWEAVIERVGEAVKRIYKGKPPKPSGLNI